MANVTLAMGLAAKIDRDAMEKRMELSEKNLEMVLAQLKSITMERTNDGNGNPWKVHLYGTYTRDEVQAILYLMDKGVE